MNVLHGSIGHHHTMLDMKAAFFGHRAVYDLLDVRAIVWMRSLDHRLDAWFDGRLAFEYAVGLLGPVDFSARHIPTETSGSAQSLRLRQVHLAAAQCVLGLLALRALPSLAHGALHRRHEPRQ